MDHRAYWQGAAERFAEVLGEAAMDAPVPGCPGWEVADLAFHLGRVYDRFTQVAQDRLTALEDVRLVPRVQRPEEDRALPGWFRARADALDAALTDLSDDEPLWNFTTAPQVAAWLPRRMLHETTVHRYDLEQAAGSVTGIAPDVARDGVDEFLTVLSGTVPGGVVDGVLELRVEEVPDGPRWHVRLEPEGVRVVDVPRAGSDGGPSGLGATLRGDAPTLLLTLWQRLPLSSVEVGGSKEAAVTFLRALAR